MGALRQQTPPIPIFDGHNDALTAPNSALLVEGGGDGHLDLPRMRGAGMRGGIFAVFVESREQHLDLSPEPGVPYVQPLPPRVRHARAAGITAIATGRLLGLERQGEVRLARSIADLDAAATDDGPPVVVLHLEGAEAIDPQLEASRPGTRRVCARSARSGAGRTRSPTGSRSPLRPPPTPARAHRGGDAAGAPLRRAGHRSSTSAT